MAIDTRYMISPVMWQLFTDKDSNTFLYNGYVLFAQDDQRTVGKKVYTISGSPPNYSYIEYGFFDVNGLWRVDLNSQGAFDVPIYLFPFEADGKTVELYFIQWFSQTDVFQHSLEGWPNIANANGGVTPVTENFVPNPQFLYHLTPPEILPTVKLGQITGASTPVAWGGWTFERPMASTATDIITFPPFPNAGTLPSANPAFAISIATTNPSADEFKYLQLKYEDVNKFSGTDDYTFGLTGRSDGASSLNVDILLVKYYGVGGDPIEITTIATFMLGLSYQEFFTTFSFGSNVGKTLGTGSYVALVISLPPGSANTTRFVNALLARGDILNPTLAYEPNSVYNYQSIAGFLENPSTDGSDVSNFLYLPTILTKTGLDYDDSKVGTVYGRIELPDALPGPAEIAGEGQTLKTSEYTSSGVPFKRIWTKWFDTTINFPITGTGFDFVSLGVIEGPATLNTIRLTTNRPGATTVISNGSIPTTFSFGRIILGSTDNWNAFLNYKTGIDTATIAIIDNELGKNVKTADAPKTDITGWTITTNYGAYPSPSFDSYGVTILNIAAATITASQYITFISSSANTPLSKQLTFWFEVDGSGLAPVVTGTDIYYKVSILSTYTMVEVAKILLSAINGSDIQTIQTVAATSVPPGSSFNFSTFTQTFTPWYTVDGIGTAPVLPAGILIKIPLLSSDADTDVAAKTCNVINAQYFGIPELRGAFLRGYDPGQLLDTSLRFSVYPNLDSATIASYQYDTVGSHTHLYGVVGASAGPGSSNNPTDSFATTDSTQASGSPQTQPRNFSVRWYIAI